MSSQPFSLANVATGDDYTSAATLTGPPSQRVSLQAYNAAVYYQLAIDSTWQPETFLAPWVGTITRPGCTGIRFRSAAPGKPAQVTAVLLSDDGADAGSVPSITVSAAGEVTTGGTVTELGYQERATPFTLAFAAAAIITLAPITFDGLTRIKLEFWAPNINTTGGNLPIVSFYDNGLHLAGLYDMNNTSGIGTIYGVRLFTPAAGAHTFATYGQEAGNTGAVVGSSASGLGVFPMWMRCTAGS